MPPNLLSAGDTYVKFSGLKKYLLYLKTAVRLFLNSVQVSQSEVIWRNSFFVSPITRFEHQYNGSTIVSFTKNNKTVCDVM